MEKELKKVLESMAASIDRESEGRYQAVIDAVMEKHPAEKMTVERFASLVSYDIIERLHDQLVKKYFPESEDDWRIWDTITNYNFMNTMLKGLMEEANGTLACSADYSRWILRSYLEYLRSKRKVLPDMTIGEGCFLKPAFGTAEEWMMLCDEMVNMTHGKATKCYVLYSTLLIQGLTERKKKKGSRIWGCSRRKLKRATTRWTIGEYSIPARSANGT